MCVRGYPENPGKVVVSPGAGVKQFKAALCVLRTEHCYSAGIKK